MDILHMTKGVRGLLGSALNAALGAGAVLVGSYIVSRIKEKRDIETRLERMEQILEKLSEKEEKK